MEVITGGGIFVKEKANGGKEKEKNKTKRASKHQRGSRAVERGQKFMARNARNAEERGSNKWGRNRG